MIRENYLNFINEVDANYVLPVSKTKSCSEIMELYDIGVKSFGENRIQELKEKYVELPKDIKWHFIGRLQSNKVRDVVKYAFLIHSVDSLKLLNEINNEAFKQNKVQDILLQINVGYEESKTGFKIDEVSFVVSKAQNMPNINIMGFMTMAPFIEDEEVLNKVFKTIYELNNKFQYPILSMGMSNDYKIALKNGSNLIRIGTSIFGGR